MSNKIKTSYDKVRNAKNLFGFTFLFQEAVEQNRIQTTNFVKNLFIKDEFGKEISKLEQNFNTNDLNDYAFNLMIMSLGTLCICMDTALKDHFGSHSSKNLSTSIKDTWDLIYMIRCAFAHDPLVPKWNITKNVYKRMFSIPQLNLNVDLSILDGQELTMGNLGGLEGILKLSEFVMSTVKS